jgi:hypothetical protein
MKRQWMRRAALAAIFTSALALAAPAHAAGWATRAPGPDLLQKAWQWIAGVWSASEREGPAARTGATLEKEGGGIDPMGVPNTSSPPPGQPQGDNGGYIDPLG